MARRPKSAPEKRTETPKPAPESRADETKSSTGSLIEQLNTKVKYLTHALIMLIGMCLVLSLVLNVYLGFTYAATRDAIKDYQTQLQDQSEFKNLYVRLVTDMQALSRTDKSVEKLLKKYRIPVGSSYSQTQASPQ